ncbi:geranylgeranyl transferase type-2 subunit beta [Phytophthora infestans T30-4]|uniref:Geranylgeranyl transferase type-2 subunit beta n=1 Tax=Phytophthora infestans (strain T30-4) TaxID=403677 RepID=D0RMJ0_PHYIT|nr:geranylgeranyl transferase type-2 subunit beta [Phytophthora infestans T30-4]EEY64417.1 geranylgeranyl transferase type-2 subunit beta [Phytophthora infestans T30-4]|eukprot:XP_002909740.1 geranylgeranyl transferase type-2 subunit beta [Phytophthora infestans T30-4]
MTEHMRVSGLYWGVGAMALLNREEEMDPSEIVEWVMQCEHPDGGFSGNVGHDRHLLYTVHALLILAMLGALDRIERDECAKYVASLQQPDGSFAAGFGNIPGCESHGGHIFTAVGALSLGFALEQYVDDELLGWWLCERQCDSGGLNGRPEKQADVCYSWWNISSLIMIGKLDWISKEKLIQFILACQDPEDGGIADRPEMWLMCSTRFSQNHPEYQGIRQIHPTFAIPTDIVEKLQLTADMVMPVHKD